MSTTYLAPPSTLGRSRCFGSTSTLNLSLTDQSDCPKRRLLLIYVHGFMGSEASFNDFPAHVHHILSITLEESHEVYTKIYPRYHSRGEMRVVRDDFSRWLSPHEASDLDVVILGHSLGGILAAEVALSPSYSGGPWARKHRILGLVNFDVPFLGLHPGVITAGIGSLFRRKPNDQQEEDDHGGTSAAAAAAGGSGSTWLGASSNGDGGRFDPSFSNDVHLNNRRGGLHGAFRFLQKHKDNLTSAVPRHFVSYYDHFGCLGDYSELKGRYQQLQELEDDANQWGGERSRSSLGDRLRFINYYTASTGYFKKEKEKKRKLGQGRLYHKSYSDTQLPSFGYSQESLPGQENPKANPYPGGQLGHYFAMASTHVMVNNANTHQSGRDSPPSVQHQQPSGSACPQMNLPEGGDRSFASTHSDESDENPQTSKVRDRKFCWVPKDANGSVDPLWARVFMEDIDEVAAHQTLFLPRGPYYDGLVGDTASRIENWVQDDLTRRTILTEEKYF